MRKVLALAFAFVAMPAIGAPIASSPATATQTARPSPAIPDNARRLSLLLNPTDKAVEVGMRGFQAGIDTELKKDLEAAAVYNKNPGLLQAIIDAGGPVLRKHLEARLPAAQTLYAGFYAEKFSPKEIDELIAFYSTPTGAKVIDAMYAGLDIQKLAQGMDKDGKLSLTPQNVAEASAAVESKLPDTFDADDWRVIFTFGATPTHAKLLRVTPEFNQLAARLQNEPDPDLDSELETAISTAVKAYMARKKDSHSG